MKISLAVLASAQASSMLKRHEKIMGHLDRFAEKSLDSDSKKDARHFEKVRKWAGQVIYANDRDGEKCDATIDDADDLNVFDGAGGCKLNSQIMSALRSFARTFACDGRGNVPRQITRRSRRLEDNFERRKFCEPECFIGDTPEVSGGRPSVKDIDLEKSFKVSIEQNCDETITNENYGTIFDISEKETSRSQASDFDLLSFLGEKPKLTNGDGIKWLTQLYRRRHWTYVSLFDGPGAIVTDHGNFENLSGYPYTSNVAGMSVLNVLINCPGDGWTLFEFEHKFDKETGLWTDMWLFGGIPAVSSSYSPENWTHGNNFHLAQASGSSGTEASVNVRNFCYQELA